MRGAVLYKLGLDFVKHRVMRLSYGIVNAPIFLPGHHPEEKKHVDIAGNIRCHDVMYWYATKACYSACFC